MSISSLALGAKKVIDAAWGVGPAYDLAAQAAFALESAQMLQSPETAAESAHYRAAFEAQKSRAETLDRLLREAQARLGEHEVSPLAWARLLDAKSLDNFLCAIGMAADTAEAEGALSQVEEMIRSFRAALPAGAEQERARTLHEHVIARDAEIEKLRARVAELEAAQGTAYRAQHDSIVMGLYTSREAAQAHCEAKVQQEEPAGSIQHMSWVADDIGPDAEYELHITPAETGGLIRGTGYVVTPLEVASEYDPEGDE
ncbi:hypothetical protein DIZ27_23265 [Streptomyces sp. NWU339]|uniref:hypothetical protein n=1 Tax=Streptomyces sp. NWU339 TaxID=2185284 RepID=UPI000D676993|nr:hypothetical protein [Streptomyces sp. NWU339]PWI08361.1 hypothetical protein DIZ27_23265 [Streptomyces sp. NWU339]